MPTTTSRGARLHAGALDIDLAAYRARLGRDPLPLSPSQLELLAFLVANRDRVVTREELASAAGLENERSVDVALTAVRRALGRDAIRNVRNRGWIFEPQRLHHA